MIKVTFLAGATAYFLVNDEGEKTLLKDADGYNDEQFEISISVNPGNSDNHDNLLTIPHETILHADKAAEVMQKFQKGEIGFDELQNWFVENQNLQDKEEASRDDFGRITETYVAGHTEIAEATNKIYEAVNDVTENLLSKIKITVVGTHIDDETGELRGQHIPEGSTDSQGREAKRFKLTEAFFFKLNRQAERKEYDPNK